MPALSVSVPFPVFKDRDGQPLNNGYVYIGVANLDAQTNPVQVYFDEALTIPAAQPLRTINGYVSNAGTPAQLYVNAVNFSIKLLDAKGTFVYSFTDGTINIDAASVSYVPAGVGAVSTTVQSKLRESVSVKDFGAVGDGVADDTEAIQAAINLFTLKSGSPATVADTGGGIYFPRGIYKVSGLTIKPVASSNNSSLNGITLFGESAVLKGTAACTRILSIDTAGDTTKNVSDIVVDGLQFDLTNMTTTGASGSVGLFLENVYASSFRNLSFFGGPTDNTHIYFSRTGSSMSFEDINCSRIVINGQDFGPAQLVLTTLQFYSVRCTGIRINAAWGLGFYGCIVENPGNAGGNEAAFQMSDCRNITIIGGDYEGASASDKYLDASAPGSYGVSKVYSVNNSVASLATYISGEISNGYFQDQYNAIVARIGAYPTTTATTSATTIFSFAGDPTSTGNTLTTAKIGVWGITGSNVFYDEVVVCFGGYVARVVTATVSGAPTTRTYTLSGTNLQLALGTGTMSIKTAALSITG